MDDLIGRKIGPYEICDVIGRGGMATVYRAHQPSLNRYVAIKVLLPFMAHDDNFVARFRQEAVAAGAMIHPNILRIYDADTFEDKHYIVMDYVTGGTLADFIGSGAVSFDAAADLAAQIAEALDYAHRRGIVHRDIKPSNILLDEEGRPLLGDFGIAQALTGGPRLTQSNTSIGTPEYMSPEQSEGHRVDGRSDLYSLGVLLYQMLTGHVPFHADTPVATLYQVVHQQPPSMRLITSAVPDYLESIVVRALAKNPDARFQNGREMAQALRQRQVVAPPPADPALIAAPSRDSAALTPRPTPRPLTLAPRPRATRSILAFVLVPLLILVLGGGAIWALGRTPPAAVTPVSSMNATPGDLRPPATPQTPAKNDTPPAAAAPGKSGVVTSTPAAGPSVPPSTAIANVPAAGPPATLTPEPPTPNATGTAAAASTSAAATAMARSAATQAALQAGATREAATTVKPQPTVGPTNPAVRALLPAPVLLAPANDASISGPSDFRWSWDGTLGPHQAFEVRIWKEAQGHYGATENVRETHKDFDPRQAYNVKLGGFGQYYWSVIVLNMDVSPPTEASAESAPFRITVGGDQGPAPAPATEAPAPCPPGGC